MKNLYGHAMSQYLPYANFRWVKNINDIEQKLMKIKSNSSTEYILEVNLEYAKNLRYEHSNYPLVPEKINRQKEWLSEISNEHNIKIRSAKKSVTNLMDRDNHVIYYRNLQQSLELGMKFEKIYRILKCKQKDWMKPYIDFNTQKRKEATNDADKKLLKLLNNAVYGKTMENMRKRIKIRVLKNGKDIVQDISKLSNTSQKILDKNLVAIHEKRICLILSKVIYVGFTVL